MQYTKENKCRNYNFNRCLYESSYLHGLIFWSLRDMVTLEMKIMINREEMKTDSTRNMAWETGAKYLAPLSRTTCRNRDLSWFRRNGTPFTTNDYSFTTNDYSFTTNDYLLPSNDYAFTTNDCSFMSKRLPISLEFNLHAGNLEIKRGSPAPRQYLHA